MAQRCRNNHAIAASTDPSLNFSLTDRTGAAVMETIRVCTERGILVRYLEKEQREVIDIMKTLFDQETIMRNHIAAQRREATEEATQVATQRVTLNAIRNLMNKLHLPAEEAMDILEIPNKERAIYAEMLTHQ